MRTGRVLGVLYMWGVILGGALVLGRWFAGLDFDHAAALAIFMFILMASQWLAVALPHGRLTCGFAVVLAAFLLFGPAAAAWTAALGLLFGQGIMNRGRPLRTTLFNAALAVLSVFAAHHAYLAVGGLAGQPLAWANVLPLLAFCVVYFFTGYLLAFLYRGPHRGRVPGIGRWTGLEWEAAVFLMLIPLGLLAALVYRATGLTGAVLVLLPLLAGQWLLARFARLMLRDPELAALHRVAHRLGTAPDFENLLNLILEETGRILPCHTAAVYLWAPEREQYVAVAVSSEYAAELKDSALEKEEGIIAWAVELREPSIIYDTRGVPRPTGEPDPLWFLRSLLVIPLVMDNEVKGILLAGDRRPYAYDERNLHILTIIARQAAVVTYNVTRSRRAARPADTDALTGLADRTAFWRELSRECGRAREGRPLSVVLLELKRLAAVNKEFGYRAGDGVLVQVAGLLRFRVRGRGYPARYDGAVFAVVLPDTGKVQALDMAAALGREVERMPLQIDGSRLRARLTVGTGVGTCPADAGNPDDLLLFAERALREAPYKEEARTPPAAEGRPHI